MPNPDDPNSPRTESPSEPDAVPPEVGGFHAARFPAENPNPVLRIGRDGRLLYANQASQPLLRAQGMRLGAPVPPEWSALAVQVLQEHLTKSIILSLEGRYLHFSIVPVLEAEYVNLYGADISDRIQAEKAEQEARRAAERYASRVMQLQEITAKLAQPLSAAEIIQTIVDQGVGAVGARAVFVALLNAAGTELELAGQKGLADDLIDRWRRFPVSAGAPLAEAVRTGAPVWIDSLEAFVKRFPALETERTPAHTTFASVPLFVDRRVIGGIGLSFGEPQALTVEDRAFILTLARQCSQALDRARLFEEKERLNLDLEQRVNDRTAQLEQVVAQLHHLAAHLQSAREEERADIARELHDDLGQFMTALRLELGMWAQDLEPEAGSSRVAREALERIQGVNALLDQTAESVRRMLRRLRPGALEDVGLVRAMEQYLDDFYAHTKIDTRFHCTLSRLDLSPDAALALYRILQEASNNVAKHAQASQMIVRLTEEPGAYILRIQDNGRGIRSDDRDKGGHFGLLGIRERAWALGGTVEISGAPGQGTLVRVRVPAAPPAP